MVASFGVGQVVWSILWFFLFLMWFMLLVQVTTDVFRSRDLSGVSKALWVLFVLFLPYLGVFVYLIARGDKMHDHQLEAAKGQQEAMEQYIREAAGTSASPADELERLSKLRDSGVIDEAEFAQLKAKILS